MNPIFASKKDHESEPMPLAMSPEAVRMSPDVQQYSLDMDNDGDTDARDFESVRERITAPVEDDAAVSREIRRLRADDILAERARRREDILNEAIIEEERQRHKLENRSPTRKAIDKAGTHVIGGLKAIPRAIATPAPAPAGAPMRKPVPMMRGRPSPMQPAPSAVGLGQRLSNVNSMTNNFGMSLMPRGGQPRGFSLGGNADAFRVRPQQNGDALANFSRNVLSGGRTAHTVPASPRMGGDALRNFNQSVLFGGMAPRQLALPPARAPVQSQERPPDMLKNFAASVGGIKKRQKENKPFKFGGF